MTDPHAHPEAPVRIVPEDETVADRTDGRADAPDEDRDPLDEAERQADDVLRTGVEDERDADR